MEIKSGFLLEGSYYIATCISLSDLILYVSVYTLQAELREKSRSRVLDASIIVSASATSGNVSYVIIPYYTNVA